MFLFFFVELGGCIICVVARALFTFKETGNLPTESLSMDMFFNKHLLPGRQEDAHEFLCHLMQAMDEAYLRRKPKINKKENTPIKQIFGGYLGTSVSCMTCDHKSTTTQYFQDLPLDIQTAKTLDMALSSYFDKEILLNMGYKCDFCKKNVPVIKQFSIERAPTSLCIQLKRYSAKGKKLYHRVNIPQHLDLSPYSSQKRTTATIRYRLTSLVTHSGQIAHSGHYEAICLNKIGNHYRFNDNFVHQIPISDVLQTSSYLLFYERQSD